MNVEDRASAGHNQLSARDDEALFQPERFDWDRLTTLYPWIARMRGIPQKAQYHAEGDVWIHTRMVAEALIALAEWQSLPAREQRLLYAAALLHDVAKPACTVFVDGLPASPGHARRGESMAREILEQCGIRTYTERESIAKLVRYHGLPLWFLDKEGVDRSLVRASVDVRLDLVALLAEADVRGRVCEDQQNLLDTIDLFRESCKSLDCYEHPRQFASDHARFMYFRNESYNLEYAAFDDRSFTATLMCGLPGAGKDTWVSQFAADVPVISLDALRREFETKPGENQSRVIATGKERARTYLREKRDFVWNATNLTRLVRDPLIELFASYGARVRIVVCHAPIAQTLKQNAKREGDARVPPGVILDMLARFDPPSRADCHEVVVHEARCFKGRAGE